jgi:hypothetical protein
MFASFECRDVFFQLSYALVEIASSRTHHHEHAGSVPTLFTAYFFQPTKTLFNRVTNDEISSRIAMRMSVVMLIGSCAMTGT